jgi:DNA replication protein DnaC
MMFWECEIPIFYKATTLEKLPLPNLSARLMALDLDNTEDATGVYLFGPTGGGKTRTVYLLAHQLIKTKGWSVRYLRGGQFQREIVNRTRPGGTDDLDAWLSDISEAELLIIDEVEKIRFSPRVESEFFELLEERLSNWKALILVSNADASGLCSRMTEDFAEAVERRIEETLIGMRFSPEDEPKAAPSSNIVDFKSA